jgi:ribonuclease HI
MWCDGACSGNPGPMTIAFVLAWLGGKRAEAYNIGNGTNNIAEFKSILVGLNIIPDKKNSEVEIITDSQLAIGILSKNWKATANLELVDELKILLRQFKKVSFLKVKGHSGETGNEFCNKLAQEAFKQTYPIIHGNLPK